LFLLGSAVASADASTKEMQRLSVSVKSLYLEKATLSQFNDLFEYGKDAVTEYVTDFGIYERLIRIEVDPNQIFYFDGDSKRFVSFNALECTLSLEDITLENSDSYSDVVNFLKNTGQAFIEIPTSKETVWIEVPFSPDSDKYLTLEFSSDGRLEKCRTWSDN